MPRILSYPLPLSLSALRAAQRPWANGGISAPSLRVSYQERPNLMSSIKGPSYVVEDMGGNYITATQDPMELARILQLEAKAKGTFQTILDFSIEDIDL